MKRVFVFLLGIFLACAVFAQDIRIASYNMLRLGDGKKDYTTLASVVNKFDVVGAIEVMNETGMKNVLAKLPQGWKYNISDHAVGLKTYLENYGFFYDPSVSVVKVLGFFPNTKHEFARPPYGVQFKEQKTGFIFNFVIVHIVYGNQPSARVKEIQYMGDVYSYFEKISGNISSTIIAGDFNEESLKCFSSLASVSSPDIEPIKKTTLGAKGPASDYDHCFVSAALKPRIKEANVYYWTSDWSTRKTVSDHFPVYCVLSCK